MSNTNLTGTIKQIAKEERENARPCDFVFGTVESGQPICIRINQKITIGERFLCVPKELTDHEVELSKQGEETVKYMIHNGLKKGESVVLLRKEGGQSYLILGRV